MKPFLTLTLCALLCSCAAKQIWEQSKYGQLLKVENLTMATVTPVPKLLRVHHTPSPTPTISPTPLPIVQTQPATSITSTSAKLNARINPNGSSTSFYFPYGTTSNYGTNTTTTGAGAGHKPLNKSATITGLTPATDYHYRTVAHNGGGTASGADTTFTTASATPTATPSATPSVTPTPTPIVVTGAATDLTQTTATLNGTVNPSNADTTYRFNYGMTNSYGTSTSIIAAGNGNVALDESAAITGLAPNTPYHFQIQGTSGGGTVNGSDATFTTSTPSPTPDPSPTPPSNPHGLATYGDPYTGDVNPSFMDNFNIVRVEARWDQINTADATYTWTALDAIVTRARGHGKQIGIALRIISDVPTWVQSLAGVTMYPYNDGHNSYSLVLPWDATARPKILAFIAAFCAHYNTTADYITMGGLGIRTETYMPLPADIGLGISNSAFLALWVTSSEGIIDTYDANLSRCVHWVAGGKVFNDSGAQAASSTVIEYNLAFSRGGTQQWGLSASSNNGFFVNAYIQNNPTHSGGFQMNGASDGSGGGNVCGSIANPPCVPATNGLSLALDNGVSLKGDVIEVYGVDAANSAYVDLFSLINAELKSSP